MIQPIGFIKLHRELAGKPIWLKSTAEQKVILVTLLMMANFKENEWEWRGEKFKVLPGQFVTSLESIVIECGSGVSIQNVRTALTRFEKLNFLTCESTKSGRLITIVNWALYQDANKDTNNDTNKDLTKTSQRPNKDLTPKEESKKEKNDKNDKNKKTFLSDSIEYRLAEHLFNNMLKNNPECKKPNLESWAKHIDLMLRVDKRKADDIKKVIDWCQKDSFWKMNILSTTKLREKYDQLIIKMNSNNYTNNTQRTRKVADF